jgi:CSLREA domain-containing protein
MSKKMAFTVLYPLMILFLSAVVIYSTQTARAGNSTTITVTSFQDTINNDGYCTLREAIIAINNHKSSGRLAGECKADNTTNTIILPSGVYTLTRTDSGNEDAAATGDLDIRANLTIQGEGASSTTIQAVNFQDRVFQVISGTVTISGVTIGGGNVNGSGGGIENDSTLTLLNSVVSGNHASGQGGGIENDSGSTLALFDSVITANKASGQGGGIFNSSTITLTLTGSTLESNTAGAEGGGIANAGNLASVNSTISGNTSTTSGGGIFNQGKFTSNNLTIAANQAGQGGGVNNASAGIFSFYNTILAGNSAAGMPDCNGMLTSQGYNLVQNLEGCTLSGAQIGNLTGKSAELGPLQINDRPTPTMALLPTSPAIDAGNPATPGSGGFACAAVDQRGVTRPQGLVCDIGAFELPNPPQTGPIYTVNAVDDNPGGFCSVIHCNLRQAIAAANAHTNGTAPDQIHFALPAGAPYVIQPLSALPTISDPVVVDGGTQPGGGVELNGSQAGAGVNGFTITAGHSTLQGLFIDHFSGSGVVLSGGSQNLIQKDTISANGVSGVVVLSGDGNSILNNSIYDNAALGIDLGGDGVSPNDAGDPDGGPNDFQNLPVLNQAVVGSGSLALSGRLNSTPDTTFQLQFFSNATCNPSGYGEGKTFLGSYQVTTDPNGDVYFQTNLNASAPQGTIITAAATDPGGNTSEFSQCVIAAAGNDSWPKAVPLSLSPSLPNTQTASYDEFIDKLDQSRWFKFAVQPGSKVIVTLTDLPANYDLTLYKDIPAAYQSITTPADLVRLNAEFAPDAFSPDAFSPDAFSPDAFSPDAFSPDAFSPDAFSPDAFSPDAFSPDAFSPDAFSPDAFSPDAFSPDAFSPDAFSPDAFSPDAFSPDAFSPDAFSSAQTRSLIAASAYNGTVSEGILVNTWSNSGDFYVRVRGRNGAFDLSKPFHLSITLLTGKCDKVSADLPASNITVDSGSYHTLILTNLSRMPASDQDKAAMSQQLSVLAARPDVTGKVVDVSSDARVAAAYQQADAYPECPYAMNLVAQAIKGIVSQYRANNPLAYIVIVGNDSVIPFFRYPDQALLASEQNYVPPVLDNTPSQASLKLSYVLSQDAYGSSLDISSKESTFPIPGLPVGRLVDTPAEVTGMVNAYLGTQAGVLPPPSSLLVTGYDFLADDAYAVQNELETGSGLKADTLITPRNLPPTDPAAWTSGQLRDKLLNSRHDLIFLAGHFSANTALAADYTTRLFTTDVISSSVDLTNAIIFSAGCHSGYNIVDSAAVPNVTLQPDWAEAFALKKATLIAGTGYQYGDTDFIKYSERIYLNFSQQLRAGTGPIAIGNALVAAKQAYLAETPQLRGIDKKALLEATLYGLPMLSVNMPQGRGNASVAPGIVSGTQPFTVDPGAALGLTYANIDVPTPLVEHAVVLTDPSATSTVTATYLSGENGVVSNPAEPVFPLSLKKVSVAGTVLRGVGFRGGAYTDTPDVRVLTGAATTEIRGVHPNFLSSVFFPVQPWQVNYFAALADSGTGPTNLSLIPVQYISKAPGDPLTTQRSFSDMQFRLFYSNNITSTNVGGNVSVPALAAAPTIAKVLATTSGSQINFQIRVVGNPAAGIQQVWVTYTALGGPLHGTWQSLDLMQSPDDSTLWQGSLPLNGTAAQDVRFMVQAANGVGLVSLDTNLGAYYTPGLSQEPTQPTSLALNFPVTSGPYGSTATFTATLTSNGTPLAGQLINFTLGPQSRQALTGSDGRATATLFLLGLPGSNPVSASFTGFNDYQSASASTAFTITQQATQILLQPQIGSSQYSDPPAMLAVLTDITGRPLGQQTVFFVLNGPDVSFASPVITDYAGRAPLGALQLPPGSYSVAVYFSGNVPLPGQTLSLSDERYLPSSVTGSLTITKEAASLAYTGDTLIQTGSPLHLSAMVTQDNDGYPGNITLAKVQFDIVDSLGNVVASSTAAVNSNGVARAILTGLTAGSYTVKSQVVGDYFTSPIEFASLEVNAPPDCSQAYPNNGFIWSPNGSLVPINILGVTDADGDPVTITVTSIYQDEPVGTGPASPDGFGIGTSTAVVRAERDGTGDGRVYHIYFTASDKKGGSCNGEVIVNVPNDQGQGSQSIDGGPLYDSTVPG